MNKWFFSVWSFSLNAKSECQYFESGFLKKRKLESLSPGQTNSQVNPSWKLGCTCDSVWPGLKKDRMFMYFSRVSCETLWVLMFSRCTAAKIRASTKILPRSLWISFFLWFKSSFIFFIYERFTFFFLKRNNLFFNHKLITYNTNITYTTNTVYNTNITYSTYVTYNTNITVTYTTTTTTTHKTIVIYTTDTVHNTVAYNILFTYTWHLLHIKSIECYI